MKIEIFRIESKPWHTIGSMRIDGKLFCTTLEPPWKDNRVNVSCIPCGSYKAKRVQSPKFGNTFEVVDVKGRTYILFHSGVWPRHTKGCVMLGQYPAKITGEDGIANSGDTFKKFLSATFHVDEFDLFITQV